MRRLMAFVAGGWLLVAGGCLPIPRAPTPLRLPPPSYRMVPDAVASDIFTVEGAPEPHTPARWDRSSVLRLRADESARAVLVLVPGLFGGARSLEVLGRQLVAATPGLQVWLVDRRSNALEDHRGFEAAMRAGDPDIALRYYLGEDGQPPAFAPPAPEQIAFMGWWGLDLHLQDLAAVIDQAHREADVVYLGGHSLGASLAALYTAYRRPDGRVGGDTVTGLILLDGAPGRTGAFDLADARAGRAPLGVTVIPSVAQLESGKVAPYLGPGVVPERVLRSAVIALYARYRPDALAPPALADFRITDLALAGVNADATYALLPTFSPSLGEAVHAETSGNIVPFLLEGAYGASSRTVVGVTPGADRVTWSEGVPAAPTDLAAYVRSVMGPGVDRAEWYFPARLLIDMAALPVDLEALPDFVPTRAVRVPTLAIGAGDGMIRDRDGFAAYANARQGPGFSSYVVPGLTHIDLISARAAPVVTLFERWSGLSGP